ncbi:MAG: SUMF1/EgtB/PvdO family nonheme iron enzyme [Candidatus Methylumidiphilus sp.]
MTWRDTHRFEKRILEDVKASWPKEMIALARCLALAPRIEPLLLRNARLHFVQEAQAEAESLLWFSPLVAARSTREIVFHLGVSKALAQECSDEQRDEHWRFTQRHTRHWSEEDRLERDLRYYALKDDPQEVRLKLREILRRIHDESEESRIALSRLLKRTMPVIAPYGGDDLEAKWLIKFAALALGDAGDWMNPGLPQALPEWLEAKLPKLPPHIPKAELGVETRTDGRNQVLHFIAADQVEPNNRIPLPSPLPAQLHVATDGPGAWHIVNLGTRIVIDPPSQHLRLTTLDGRQCLLRTETALTPTPLSEREGLDSTRVSPLWLAHTKADKDQAQAIADWLKAQGVDAELFEESASSASPSSAEPKPTKVVRLWTQAAHRYWAERPAQEAKAVAEGLLLLIEDVDLPQLGTGLGHVLDWRDWTRLDASPNAQKLLDKLRRWRDGGEIEPNDKPLSPPGRGVGERGQMEFTPEIQSLLAEIDNPDTPPPRRLEIGDLLAELGDPRPGVGVVEIEVPIPLSDARSQADAWERDPSAVGANSFAFEDSSSGRMNSPLQEGSSIKQGEDAFPPQIQALLDEINNPATEPPRRLEIGDELDKLGDPRRGVGLDASGLPDIDWVEIPGGPFIYQNGETHELPTYWISRYPITNRQFQAFIDAGSYQKNSEENSKAKQWLNKLTGQKTKTELVLAELWKDLQQPQPAKSNWPQGNRPRTDVDWYEAVAFTRWLSAVLGLEESAIRLPTEQEWEKAARGEHGLVYPWGNEYRSGFANIDEKSGNVGKWYLKQTTAVGLYPHGCSPYEVEDMAGTVWEWCLNKYEKPDMTKADTSGDSRVLRGGSWVSYRDLARAVDRYWLVPVLRNNLRGFRVLSSVPIHAVR